MESDSWVERVKGVMNRSLHALDMTTPNIPVDQEFSRLCHETARSKGYMSDGWMSLASYLEAGVALSQVGYAHLGSLEARVWIAIWTGFLTVLDDTYPDAPEEAVTFFVVRMLSGKKQPYPHLEHFAAHLREVTLHADELRAGIILTSTFNWVTSLQIDRVMLDKEIPPAAERFPTWCSLLSGLCEGFAMFAFPPDVPFHVIAPAIPDMLTAIRTFNDIFSYYKEEMAGECTTYICRLADMRGQGDIVGKIRSIRILCMGRPTSAYGGSGPRDVLLPWQDLKLYEGLNQASMK